MSTDGSQHWDKFKQEINLIDNLRGENFWNTFSELSELKNK
jgi:hypothetical protein